MDQAWHVHKRQSDAIVRQATTMLIDFARRNPAMTVDDLRFIYEAVIDQYGSAAAESALQALITSREADGYDSLPGPVVVDRVPPGQIAGTFDWAVSQTEDPQALARKLVGPLGRLVQQTGRRTVLESTALAQTRYARVPGPNACWFCLMLASRGAVYRSRETASLTGERSGTTPERRFRNDAAQAGHSYNLGTANGASFHDNCDCTVVEIKDTRELPPLVSDLYDEWVEVTWDASGPAPDQIGLWKKHIAETRPNGETIRPK